MGQQSMVQRGGVGEQFMAREKQWSTVHVFGRGGESQFMIGGGSTVHVFWGERVSHSS